MNELVVAFFGKCGVGKTTTINSLFGLNWEIGHAKATTLQIYSTFINPKEYLNTLSMPDCILRIIDTPGISESQIADKTYYSLYKEIVPEIDYIYWLFQADTRTYRADQEMLSTLVKLFCKSTKIIIGINHIDQMCIRDSFTSAEALFDAIDQETGAR